jgi:hypothetical protein
MAGGRDSLPRERALLPGSKVERSSRLNLTRAIVDLGTFQIDTVHEAHGWAAGDKALLQGRNYSDKAIGAPMMVTPTCLPCTAQPITSTGTLDATV